MKQGKPLITLVILILAATVTLCCMKTAIGLVTACSETFLELFPGKLDYPKWAVVFTGASLLISNIGLSQIIALSAPVLYFLCPLAIVLILLGIAGNRFGHARVVYGCTMGAALAAAPIITVFLIFQKYFTQGITMGAVKG